MGSVERIFSIRGDLVLLNPKRCANILPWDFIRVPLSKALMSKDTNALFMKLFNKPPFTSSFF